MDIVFEFTFGVNYKSYLLFLNAKKKKYFFQNVAMWPCSDATNNKEYFKEYLKQQFFQIRKFLYFLYLKIIYILSINFYVYLVRSYLSILK